MEEWVIYKQNTMIEFICPGCGILSHVRKTTQKKVCKACHKTWVKAP
jgi:predicted RNA-binding Zn-ribbon protein involved in translation (DUF1610 family)